MTNGHSRGDGRSGAAGPAWIVPLADLAATEAFGRQIAEQLRPGDLVTLSGGLGAGKTALARTIVQALAGDPELEVPSPTFTLMQAYDTPGGAVVHADFYRLSGAHELYELGWDEITDSGIALVEWPERAEEGLKAARLNIALDFAPDGSGGRVATLTATGAFAPRLAQWQALRNLLEQSGWAQARRVPIHGDASGRAYMRLVRPDGRTAILMIAPPRLLGPPVRRGKPYTTIAKLAETVHAFVAIDRGLRELGLSAPAIYGEALEAGLLVIEDLGDEPVVDAQGPIPERYGEATQVLARLHGTELPSVLPVSEGRDHAIPPFDLEALLIEAELVLDWYMPHIRGTRPSGSVRAEFVNLWSETLAEIVAAPPTWTLRDFHSPNLIWLPKREGLQRVGLIDFQDTVLGHPAYDVASLLQDARVTVPPDLELKLLGLYARARRRTEPGFDTADFARAYAIMGAQRNTKILGIFARLDKRDGKPQYLRHLPRVEAYLARNLAHPALARLKAWYDAVLPRLGVSE